MLIDFEYNHKNKKLICSYIENGNIKVAFYPWIGKNYVVCSDDDPEKSKYVTWDGKSVKEIYSKNPSKLSIYYFLDSLPEEEKEMLFGYDEPHIYFVDIENEVINEKPQPHLAQTKILTISIVSKNKALVMGIDNLSEGDERSIENDINNEYGKLFDKEWKFKYVRYKSEYELLYEFFNKFVPKMPVITGWNFKHYDWVYLVNRARKLSIDPSVSSLTKSLYKENPSDSKNHCELPKHRLIVDYMEIFDKWDTNIKVKESLSLDFVSEKLLNVKKVNYEGDLKILYEHDFKKFVYYNVVDAILVQLIHEKTRLIDIMYAIASLSKVSVKSAMSTLAVTEGILRDKLKKEKNIILIRENNHENDGDEDSSNVIGAWVKEPVKGIIPWTCCFDFASLYPTIMRQFNIAPDSYMGEKVENENCAIFNGKKIDIDLNNVIITKNGSVFNKSESILSRVLTEIYEDRKKYKNMMIQKTQELHELRRKLKELENDL